MHPELNNTFFYHQWIQAGRGHYYRLPEIKVFLGDPDSPFLKLGSNIAIARLLAAKDVAPTKN